MSVKQPVSQYLLNASLFGPKRQCSHAYDFGDDATVGKHLKRVGSSIEDPASPEENKNYGVYLGKQDAGYVVGIKGIFSWEVEDVEIFETLDNLKMKWMLD